MSKSISLHYKGGGSDKVYHVQIEENKAGGWNVCFQYGRRGSALASGRKVTGVGLDRAQDVFDKLVAEKVGKGYQVIGGDAKPPVGDDSKKPSGILPQLLNPITEDEAMNIIGQTSWCAQEKYDGHHKMIRKVGDVIEGINKKGQVVPLPDDCVSYCQMFPFDFVIDCEHVGDKFYAFDMLALDALDMRQMGYAERYRQLKATFAVSDDVIVVIPTAFTNEEKAAMFERLKAERAEGIVFKVRSASFTPGRPNSGGNMLKCKFWKMLHARVKRINEKNSIECELMGALEWVTCGNVTIHENVMAKDKIRAGDIVELRYLYALESTGILTQPNYWGKRDDVDASECSTNQLQYKQENEICI